MRTSSGWMPWTWSMADVDRIVVLGSSLTALAIVRAAKALGISSILFDTRRGIAFDSRHPMPIHCPSGNDELLLQQLEAVASKESAALIADSDGWLRFIVRCRPAFTGPCSALETGTELVHQTLSLGRVEEIPQVAHSGNRARSSRKAMRVVDPSRHASARIDADDCPRRSPFMATAAWRVRRRLALVGLKRVSQNHPSSG